MPPTIEWIKKIKLRNSIFLNVLNVHFFPITYRKSFLKISLKLQIIFYYRNIL